MCALAKGAEQAGLGVAAGTVLRFDDCWLAPGGGSVWAYLAAPEDLPRQSDSEVTEVEGGRLITGPFTGPCSVFAAADSGLLIQLNENVRYADANARCTSSEVLAKVLLRNSSVQDLPTRAYPANSLARVNLCEVLVDSSFATTAGISGELVPSSITGRNCEYQEDGAPPTTVAATIRTEAPSPATEVTIGGFRAWVENIGDIGCNVTVWIRPNELLTADSATPDLPIYEALVVEGSNDGSGCDPLVAATEELVAAIPS